MALFLVCIIEVRASLFYRLAHMLISSLQKDGLENDADGLVGKGEALLKQEEWEDAVRVFETAFEASGRSSRDVCTMPRSRLDPILTSLC